MPIGLRSNTLVGSMRIAADPRTTGNPMPTPRYFAAAAVAGGEILVADGNFETNVLRTLETYNPLTDTWAVRAPMPTARAHWALTQINGKLLVFGNTCRWHTTPPTRFVESCVPGQPHVLRSSLEHVVYLPRPPPLP